MRPIACVEDLRGRAKSRVPKWIFDYADGGSYGEYSLRENAGDFAKLHFRQRVLVDVSRRQLNTTILGQDLSIPLVIAPTGLAGFFHADGEICAARAAEASGIPYCLSTLSIASIEDLQKATTKPFWFQLYVMRDRAITRSLMERAWAAGCSTLVLTLDLQIQGQRHRDIHNGLVVPPRMGLRHFADILTHPRWTLGMLRAGKTGFGNLREYGGGSALGFGKWIAESFDPSLTWRDIEWVKLAWPGKLVLKGILDAEDATRAVDVGADAIIVSNHGGRQLDCAPSSISQLPRIAEIVDNRLEVMFDGGVSTGQHVLKALALGARCCLVGKAQLFGLAAYGEWGVRKVIQIIRNELDVTMALTGLTNIRDISSEVLSSFRSG